MEGFLQKIETNYINTQLSSYFYRKNNLGSYTNMSTYIPAGVFYEQTALYSVSFPLATVISNYAFAYCSNLDTKRIYFPEVIVIGDRAFANAFSLQYAASSTVEFPKCLVVRMSAFESATINRISLPLCSRIFSTAFKDCTNLYEIYAPECEEVMTDAFSGCTWLRNITLPKCSSLYDGAFKNCSNLETITLNGMEYDTLKTNVFSGCVKLKSLRMDNLIFMSKGALKDCVSLSELSLPNLHLMANMDLPSNIKTITINRSTNTLFEFTSLSYVEEIRVMGIPVTHVGSSVFMDCHSLERVLGIGEATLIDTSAFKNCYKLMNVALDKVVSIYADAFANCSSLKAIYAPKLTNIGNRDAFANCIGLVNVDLPILETVTGFKGCTNLRNVYLSGCKSIEWQAFMGCTNLTNVVAPECVTLGDNAFAGCTELQAADFPKVNKIGASVFNGAYVRSINLPAVTRYDGDFMKNNPSLNYVSFGGYKFSGAGRLFMNCPNINEMHITGVDDFNHTYGANLFDPSCHMKSLYLEDAVDLGSNAFQWLFYGYVPSDASAKINNANCFENLYLPKCTHIGSIAVKPTYHTSTVLETLSIPVCETIDEEAFCNQSKLVDLTMPAAKTIKNSAFWVTIKESIYKDPNLCPTYVYTFPQSEIVNFVDTPFGITVNNSEFYDKVNILVPPSMVDAYKARYSKTVYGSRIFAYANV